jgi:hypothetical protein
MKSWHLLGVAVAITVSFASCAGAPEPAAGTSPVSCDLLSNREISLLSTTRVTNPFMPTIGIVQGSRDEFVVARIRLVLPEPTLVVINGSVTGDAGNAVAPLKTYQQMTRYWTEDAGDIDYRDARTRSDVLTRWYPPDLQFTAKAGRSEFVVAFIGKNPLPRPASVTLSVALGDAPPQEFTFPLPPRK